MQPDSQWFDWKYGSKIHYRSGSRSLWDHKQWHCSMLCKGQQHSVRIVLRLCKGKANGDGVCHVKAEGTYWSPHLVGTWVWSGVLPVHTLNGAAGRGPPSLGLGSPWTGAVLAVCRSTGRCAGTDMGIRPPSEPFIATNVEERSECSDRSLPATVRAAASRCADWLTKVLCRC